MHLLVVTFAQINQTETSRRLQHGLRRSQLYPEGAVRKLTVLWPQGNQHGRGDAPFAVQLSQVEGAVDGARRHADLRRGPPEGQEPGDVSIVVPGVWIFAARAGPRQVR